ncbi:MAG: amidohydrolase family protein [Acidobacteriota bacterium]
MKETTSTPVIDAWAQITTPRMAQSPFFATLRRWTATQDDESGTTVEATVAAMDEAGVDLSLVAGWHGPQGSLISNDEVEAQIDAAPERLRGLVGVDLTDPMGSVRDIKRLTADGRFVGVRIIPWLWERPPNHRSFYPIYVACVEAGVPFCTQVGHTGPLRTSETGRPIPYLEDVLLDFPELVVVGGHVGFPWIHELKSLCIRFPNFYLDTSAYVLDRLPPEFVDLMKGVARGRVLFGTNWPMLPPARCLKGLDALELDADEREGFLGGIAARVFKL